MICACTIPMVTPELKFKTAEGAIGLADVASSTRDSVPDPEVESGRSASRYLLD
jgi:hypothetical protein